MNEPVPSPEPSRADLLFKDAILHQQAGRIDIALEHYQQVLAEDPNHVYALANTAAVLRRQDKLLDALQYLVKAAKLAPENPGIHNNLGNALSDAGALKEAASCFRKALRNHPNDAILHCNYGRVLLKTEEPEKALEHLNKAIEIKPEYPEPRLCLGIYYHDTRDFEAAEMCFKDILHIQPGHVPALFNLATLLRRRKRLPEALAAYEQLLAMQPNNAKIQYWVDALKQNTPKRAPTEYVAGVFNDYAPTFEEHLASLKYSVPESLRSLYDTSPLPAPPVATLDLGCGTGLAGKQFADIAKPLAGIDLAKKMLAIAKKKNIYNTLHAGDIYAYLKQSKEQFQLVLASDVLIYLGDLEPFFPAVSNVLTNDSRLIFSTERGKQGYVLQDNGRYTHADDYVETTAKAAGFTLLKHEHSILRYQESTGPVEGSLWMFER